MFLCYTALFVKSVVYYTQYTIFKESYLFIITCHNYMNREIIKPQTNPEPQNRALENVLEGPTNNGEGGDFSDTLFSSNTLEENMKPSQEQNKDEVVVDEKLQGLLDSINKTTTLSDLYRVLKDKSNAIIKALCNKEDTTADDQLTEHSNSLKAVISILETIPKERAEIPFHLLEYFTAELLQKDFINKNNVYLFWSNLIKKTKETAHKEDKTVLRLGKEEVPMLNQAFKEGEKISANRIILDAKLLSIGNETNPKTTQLAKEITSIADKLLILTEKSPDIFTNAAVLEKMKKFYNSFDKAGASDRQKELGTSLLKEVEDYPNPSTGLAQETKEKLTDKELDDQISEKLNPDNTALPFVLALLKQVEGSMDASDANIFSAPREKREEFLSKIKVYEKIDEALKQKEQELVNILPNKDPGMLRGVFMGIRDDLVNYNIIQESEGTLTSIAREIQNIATQNLADKSIISIGKAFTDELSAVKAIKEEQEEEPISSETQGNLEIAQRLYTNDINQAKKDWRRIRFMQPYSFYTLNAKRFGKQQDPSDPIADKIKFRVKDITPLLSSIIVETTRPLYKKDKDLARKDWQKINTMPPESFYQAAGGMSLKVKDLKVLLSNVLDLHEIGEVIDLDEILQMQNKEESVQDETTEIEQGVAVEEDKKVPGVILTQRSQPQSVSNKKPTLEILGAENLAPHQLTEAVRAATTKEEGWSETDKEWFAKGESGEFSETTEMEQEVTIESAETEKKRGMLSRLIEKIRGKNKKLEEEIQERVPTLFEKLRGRGSRMLVTGAMLVAVIPTLVKNIDYGGEPTGRGTISAPAKPGDGGGAGVDNENTLALRGGEEVDGTNRFVLSQVPNTGEGGPQGQPKNLEKNPAHTAIAEGEGQGEPEEANLQVVAEEQPKTPEQAEPSSETERLTKGEIEVSELSLDTVEPVTENDNPTTLIREIIKKNRQISNLSPREQSDIIIQIRNNTLDTPRDGYKPTVWPGDVVLIHKGKLQRKDEGGNTVPLRETRANTAPETGLPGALKEIAETNPILYIDTFHPNLREYSDDFKKAYSELLIKLGHFDIQSPQISTLLDAAEEAAAAPENPAIEPATAGKILEHETNNVGEVGEEILSAVLGAYDENSDLVKGWRRYITDFYGD